MNIVMIVLRICLKLGSVEPSEVCYGAAKRQKMNDFVSVYRSYYGPSMEKTISDVLLLSSVRYDLSRVCDETRSL